MSNELKFTKAELAEFDEWLDDDENIDLVLFVQTILAGQTNSGLVSVSHIRKVAEDFGVKLEV